ncbi:hypothetical protein SAMN05216249_1382 [Acetitomaculum ruminis DSM 5522]|uniref:Peptidase M50 domain-containing protein n=1 Tax=Acetitomaculum ruminis DSM 5522 TaxID=1120918 RepID=A0A1I1AQE0_9FIRM|nr:site-2 protease family protein [Acetitomaculum ruminis]SFB40147.1 hypothetical protein SAMN05216249_1382 [Acetitomaculum ruminis DSM 5522]
MKKEGRLFFYAVFGITGFLCTLINIRYLNAALESDNRFNYIFVLVDIVCSLVVALYTQVIVHETGHLVFGYISGYGFSSFRIGSYVWIKKDGKIQLKRYRLSGTGGQCLMVPPKFKDDKVPFIRYNLGGIAFNVFFAVFVLFVKLILALFFKESVHFTVFLNVQFIVALSYAVTNGIPASIGGINNDGYNALIMRNNPKAINAFYTQLIISSMSYHGVRLKDMPEEYFVKPDKKEMKNSMIATLGVFYAGRLMDQHKIDEAVEYMEYLLNDDEVSIAGVNRELLINDMIYCELIEDNRKHVIESYMTKEHDKVISTMKNDPAIIRTNYAYSLFYERDEEKAQKYKIEFENVKDKYPYVGEIESQTELMILAKDLY